MTDDRVDRHIMVWMSDLPLLSRISIVLFRPKSPGNVGAVARAMKNMGFDRLRLADPIRYRDPAFFATESERMAWGASDLLARREEYASIEAAVAGTVLVAGSVSPSRTGDEVLTPRELATRMLAAAREGEVALLLGQEDIGLTREALSRCQVVGTIPSSTDYPALNLAQAALVFMYEIRLAAVATCRDPTMADDPRSEASRSVAGTPPTQAEIEGFYGRLTVVLDEIGYLKGDGRGHRLRELRGAIGPALRTRRSLKMLEGAVHRIDRALAHGRGSRGR